jgi:hypothetical protein
MKDHKIDDLVVIYKTHDRGMAGLVKSLMDNYEIKYFTLNENLNNAFSSGILLGGFTDPIIPPIEILVSKSDENNAEIILKDIEEK